MKKGIIIVISLLLLNLSFLPNNSLGFLGIGTPIDQNLFKMLKEEVVGKKIILVPPLNKLRAGFGREGDIEYYYTKSISKMFFQDRELEVDIKDLDYHKESLSLELSHPVIGKGNITFSFEKEDLEKASKDTLKSILLTALSSEENCKLFCNKDTNTCHLCSSNHIPDTASLIILTPKEAEDKGYTKCGFCFKKMLYLPEISLEQALSQKGAADVRYYRPLLNESAKKEYLEKIGTKILKNWPYELIGYDYTFQIVESPNFNACACAAGKIFINSALIDALENEEELEAVLAHEITHVERRHLLKTYKTRCAATEAEILIGAMGAAMTGVAASQNNNQTAGVIGAFTMLSVAALEVSIYGYELDFEKEADRMAILYFDRSGRGRENIDNVFKKLGFYNLYSYGALDIEDETHPYISERIARIEKIKFHHFEKAENWLLEQKNKPPVQLSLVCQSIYEKENLLDVYLNDYTFISEALTDFHRRLELHITDKNREQKFILNKKFITRDLWGVHLTLDRSYSSVDSAFLDEIKNVSLIIENDAKDYLHTIPEIYSFSRGEVKF